MPAPDSEVEPDKIPAGAAHFANTHWSIVLSDGDKRNPTRALQSLEKLCRLYWHPLYFYARRQGENPPDAQDLTQEFFARLLQNDLLDSVDRGKGRFRSFLLAAFKHFLSNERDKARAQKRGGGQIPIPIDAGNAETHYSFEPVHGELLVKQPSEDEPDHGNGVPSGNWPSWPKAVEKLRFSQWEYLRVGPDARVRR